MITKIFDEQLKKSLRGVRRDSSAVIARSPRHHRCQGDEAIPSQPRNRLRNPVGDCFALRARNDKRMIAFVVLTLVMILSAVSLAAAQETPEETVIKEMAGPIIYLTPRAKPEVIYIGNDAANTDYSFIINKDTRVEHMKDLISLKVGDTVKIEYEEISEITKMGGRKVVVDKRVAKVISFVRAGAAKKEAPGSASEPKTGVFVSD